MSTEHEEHRWEDDGGRPFMDRLVEGVKAVGRVAGAALHGLADALQQLEGDDAPAIAAAKRGVKDERSIEERATLDG